MLNFSWLFCNLHSINIDYESDIYKNTSKLEYVRENISSTDSLVPLIKTILENRAHYEMIIFIPFFSSIYMKNKVNTSEFSLDLNIPDSLQIEIDLLFKQEKLLTNNFHLLDLIDINSNLLSLNLSFNSLDSNTFIRVISLLHKNNSLREIKLNLFPDCIEEYFDVNQLHKLVNLNKGKSSYNNKYNFYWANYNTNICSMIDENENLLNFLSILFEENLESLVFMLNTKIDKIKSFKIQFDIPSFLYANDKYINILHKLFINLIMMIETNQDELDYTPNATSTEIFEISSKNFCLNSKNYQFVEEKLRNINLNKNKRINKFILNLRFQKINYIDKIIPNYSEYVVLPHFDEYTFRGFINTMIKLEKNFLPNLERLDINLSDILFRLNNENFKLICDFFKINFPSNLREIYFNFNRIQLEDEMIDKLIEIIKSSIKCNIKINLIFTKWKITMKSLILPNKNSFKTIFIENKNNLISMFCLDNLINKNKELKSKLSNSRILKNFCFFLSQDNSIINLISR